MIVTGTGRLDLAGAVFHTPRTRVLILTTEQGKQRLSRSGSEALALVEVKALSTADQGISPSAILTLLKQEAGVELLLHEAGPTLFGEFLAGRFIDEVFLTVAPQIAGRVAAHPRPGLVATVEFSPAAAPWWELLSAKRASDYLFFALPAGRIRAHKRPVVASECRGDRIWAFAHLRSVKDGACFDEVFNR